MGMIFAWLAQGLFFLVVACFVLYVVLELRVLAISRKVERRRLTELSGRRQAADRADLDGPDRKYPPVSVLLPICNESAVVGRLIDAVCEMQYPAQALEILVLDDSTDETSALAQRRVDEQAARGVRIRRVGREARKGYKAGNLINGIRQASGELFVIFDADFAPPPDFLLRTVPCFDDPGLGFLQTGIGYENRDVNFLTRFQAMEMGHQQVVTVGLSAEGDMASLSGSSCVWRRSCVETLGGWNASTVTEDVDLGYRAQISDWKYAYLRDVVSMSVLPETVSAFRVQRERWGRGLMHSAFKHVGRMFRQRMPVLKRLHALAMMFSSLLLATIYGLVLLTLPLNYLMDFEGMGLHWVALGFFGMVAVWGLNNVFAARQGARMTDRPGVLRTLWDTYVYVALFLPMAWYYFVGGLRALAGVYGEFNRTPKGADERRSALPVVHRVLWLGEVFTLVYSALAMWVAWRESNYFLLPINLTVCLGFGLTVSQSWREGSLRLS